jgi:glycosyltransferase involved in cell wall biosynthesis
MLWKNKGVQVVISAFNSEDYLSECLQSIEEVMQGQKWIMLFGDDGSADSTYEIAERFSEKSSARHWKMKKFSKAKNCAAAKNRVFKMCLENGHEYPAICMMDSDDLMRKERLDLVEILANTGSKFAFGDYEILYPDGNRKLVDTDYSWLYMSFGWWATAFHYSLIPQTGKIWDEKFNAYSDIYTSWHLRINKNLKIVKAKGLLTHTYIKRKGSVNDRASKKDLLKLKIAKYQLLKENGCVHLYDPLNISHRRKSRGAP